MSVEVVMPQMGESITEGTVSKWLKKVGERVEKDEAVLEISTDKVDAEVPSPGAGVLLEIRTAEGDTVEVGTVLAVIGEEGEVSTNGGAPAAAATQKIETAAPMAQQAPPEPVAEEIKPVEAAPTPSPKETPAVAPAGGDAIEVVMPQMGESITEGTVSKWLKAVGDKVDKDEALLEISTDKVDAEVPSPAAGTLLAINVNEGETVEVGSVLASIGAEGAAAAKPAEPAKAAEKPSTAPIPATEMNEPQFAAAAATVGGNGGS